MTLTAVRSTPRSTASRARVRVRGARRSNALVAQYVRELSSRDELRRRDRERYLQQPGAIRQGS